MAATKPTTAKTTAKKAPAKKAPTRKPSSKPKDPVPTSSRELYPIIVGGVDYMLREPKGYAGIVIASRFQSIEAAGEDEFDAAFMEESIDLLVNAMFTKADRAKVKARMMDADDDLDMTDLMEAFSTLSEKSTANPTT